MLTTGEFQSAHLGIFGSAPTTRTGSFRGAVPTRVSGSDAQHGSGRRHRYRQDTSCRGAGPGLDPKRRQRTVLQCGGSGQPAAGRTARRTRRRTGRTDAAAQLRGARRARLPAVRPGRRPVAVSPDLQTLRARAGGDHHQPEFRRMGQCVRRREDDLGAARPVDPSLRDLRNRQPQLALSQSRRAAARRSGCDRARSKTNSVIRSGATR